jgi:Outer membrane protein beta-barrel domain
MRLLWMMILLAPSLSWAQYNEYFEVGLSGNYRKVYLTELGTTERAFDENLAYTGSLAYYFREMTAIEFSYSQGKNTRYIPSNTITSTTTHRYSMFGADLVFTFGKRTDTFIPYIKAGVAYFDKKSIDYEYINSGVPQRPQTVEINSTVVPSAGFGMQFRITQRISFKAGLEFWTSGAISKDIEDFDWAARMGISWFL